MLSTNIGQLLGVLSPSISRQKVIVLTDCAYVTAENVIFKLDLATGKQSSFIQKFLSLFLTSFCSPTGKPFNSLAMSENGKLLAAGEISAQSSITIFNVMTKEVVATFDNAHKGGVTCMCMNLSNCCSVY